MIFSPDSPEIVRLVFLIATPAERSEVQLSLLAKVAGLVGDPFTREELRRAASPAEILEILSKRSP